MAFAVVVFVALTDVSASILSIPILIIGVIICLGSVPLFTIGLWMFLKRREEFRREEYAIQQSFEQYKAKFTENELDKIVGEYDSRSNSLSDIKHESTNS